MVFNRDRNGIRKTELIHLLTMKTVLLFLLVSAYFVGYGQVPGEFAPKNSYTALNDSTLKSDYSYEVVHSVNGSWGYDIYKGKKLFIHQLNIPGLPGNDGFKTRKDAENVAMLVIMKLKNGIMPPTVSNEELKGLKIL